MTSRPSDPEPAGRPGGPPRPAAALHQQRATAALFMAMLSLFGLLAISNLNRGIDIVAFTLVAGVVAAWFGATAIGRARHHGTALPRGSITALVIAGIGIAISAILLAGFALLGRQLTAYSQCINSANTVTAQQACRSQFTHAVSGPLASLQTAAKR